MQKKSKDPKRVSSKKTETISSNENQDQNKFTFKTLSLIRSKKGGSALLYNTQAFGIIKKIYQKRQHLKREYVAYANNAQLIKIFHTNPIFSQYFIRILKVTQKDGYVVSTIQEYQNQLFGFLQQKEISLEFKISLTLQIIIAIDQLHERGIIHNDFTPRNILIDSDNTIKICDFDGIIFVSQDKKGLIGTPEYKSSTYYKHLETFFEKLLIEEIMSIRIIIAQIFQGYPYQQLKEGLTVQQVMKQVYKRKQDKPLNITCENPTIKLLIQQLLSDLCTMKNLQDVKQGKAFQGLKQFISASKYRIVEFEEYHRESYICNEKFMEMQQTFKKCISQLVDENSAFYDQVKKIRDKLKSLVGEEVNLYFSYLNKISKNNQNQIDMKGFKKFISETLKLSIKQDIVEKIFNYLDLDGNKQIDHEEVLALCILDSQGQKKLKDKLMARKLIEHRRQALTQKNMNRR